MKRTIMSYIIATVVSLAAVGGLTLHPLSQAAQAQTSPPGGQPAASLVTNPVCGQRVSGVVNLTSNLSCSGDGIIVGADNTVINMNGHTISNTGGSTSNNKVGIMVPMYDNVAINGVGTISGFQAGVLVTGANSLQVNKVTLLKNEIGLFATGADKIQLTSNTFDSNNIGFATHSVGGATLTTNTFTDNNLAGMTLVNSHDSTIALNTVAGNTRNGLFLDSQSDTNRVEKNNFAVNAGLDINNANGLAANINANQFTDNNCNTSNPSGICIGK